MAATRTSSRQASLKAKEAIFESSEKKVRAAPGAKRKSSSDKGPEPKREKKEEEGAEEDGGVMADSVTQPQEPEEPVKRENLPEMSTVKGEEPEIEEIEKTQIQEHPVLEQRKAEGQSPGFRSSQEREDIVPSNILEKGIIYFFYRPRVNIEQPVSMGDIARSFFVLRPTPLGAALTPGSMAPGAKCRLMMLPKKKFPTSGRERDMGFVEKAGVSIKMLDETFIAGETYETSTRGERHRPEARPYAEGVYAITSTRRASHLAYVITIPSEVGDLQHDFGIGSRGSWIVQSKNPKFPGPSYARLPKDPEYPAHVVEKFKDLRWVPLEPELIDYPNAQFLMIGEAQDDLGKAATAEPGGKQPTEEEPGEELEKLEHENEERIEALSGDHTVYQDLGLDAKNYPDVPTTWNSE